MERELHKGPRTPRPGTATFVPPPHEIVPDLMSDLESFLHDEATSTPSLLEAAIARVRFVTIHPFLDGNGPLGRTWRSWPRTPSRWSRPLAGSPST